eukprot:GFUD01128930.1.p1 GENE.GFUD01128930.1~~GFUD01128930.1.p1  ORF type:complete len:118 (+),score=25.99 GFUD01128930.1:354-707(+)
MTGNIHLAKTEVVNEKYVEIPLKKKISEIEDYVDCVHLDNVEEVEEELANFYVLILLQVVSGKSSAEFLTASGSKQGTVSSSKDKTSIWDVRPFPRGCILHDGKCGDCSCQGRHACS